MRPRGDVNCDWEFSVADVNCLVDIILGQDISPTPYNSYFADINGDKEIGLADVNVAVDGLLQGGLPPMPCFSGTLPVLYINTEGYRNITGKSDADYIDAVWWIDANSMEGYVSIGSKDNPLGLLIKGHGNSTWTNLDKKSYRLKFNEKHEVLGMPSSRHWVLMANAEYWMGQLNDALPFEIGRRMGMAWNPRMQPVEVVLNGDYIGLYFLTEKIRVAKHRVNIQEQDDLDTDPERITGGWLLEIDNYKESGNITFVEGNGNPFWVTTHSPEQLSTQQREYITSFMTEADQAIYCSDKSSTLWEQYIDIDSLAVFYIVQEVIDNPEAFSGSCYMHKHRGDSTRLIFGPLWDCGSAFHRYDSALLVR